MPAKRTLVHHRHPHVHQDRVRLELADWTTSPPTSAKQATTTCTAPGARPNAERTARGGAAGGLTGRELEILRLVAEGTSMRTPPRPASELEAATMHVPGRVASPGEIRGQDRGTRRDEHLPPCSH